MTVHLAAFAFASPQVATAIDPEDEHWVDPATFD
jgi:hypothetical protein